MLALPHQDRRRGPAAGRVLAPYPELSRRFPGQKVALVVIAAGVAVPLLWISLNASWMIIGSVSEFDPRDAGRLDWPLVPVRVGGVLVVLVIEELFWRSFLMRWIDATDFEKVDLSQAGPQSFLITIVLFGFGHNLWLAGIVAVRGLLRAVYAPPQAMVADPASCCNEWFARRLGSLDWHGRIGNDCRAY